MQFVVLLTHVVPVCVQSTVSSLDADAVFTLSPTNDSKRQVAPRHVSDRLRKLFTGISLQTLSTCVADDNHQRSRFTTSVAS